jgi:hypothetical protein
MNKRFLIASLLVLFSSTINAQKVYIGFTFRPIAGSYLFTPKTDKLLDSRSFKVIHFDNQTQANWGYDIALGNQFMFDFVHFQITTGYMYAIKEYKIKATHLVNFDEFKPIDTTISEDAFEVPLFLGLTILKRSIVQPYIDVGINYNIHLSAVEKSTTEDIFPSDGIYKNKLYGRSYLEYVIGLGVRYKHFSLIARHYYGNGQFKNTGILNHTGICFSVYGDTGRFKKNAINIGEL